MVYKSGPTFLQFCHKARVWQTEKRTDGQTSEFSSLSRLCITCSAVKTMPENLEIRAQTQISRVSSQLFQSLMRLAYLFIYFGI